MRARTIAKPRLGCCPPSRRHSSRCQTARFAASAAQHISFPRRIFRARVVASRFFVSTASLLPWPALRRACAQILGVSCSSGPEMRGRRNAGRRYCRRRARKCATLTLAGVPVPRNRDVRLSALHRGAVGPGPLSRSGVAAGSGAMGCSRQAPSCLTAEPGFSYPSVTSRGRRHAPAPPSAGSLLESAL